MQLRKTKRHIRQDIAEWDEEHDPVDSKAPTLEWGFINDDESNEGDVDDDDDDELHNPNAPGQVSLQVCFAWPKQVTAHPHSASLSGLKLQHKKEDTDVIEPESEAVTAELKKADFPEVEGDVAPSAVVPKACKALTKQVTKIDGLISVFLAASQLSTLQEKNLVCLIFDGLTCPTIFLWVSGELVVEKVVQFQHVLE